MLGKDLDKMKVEADVQGEPKTTHELLGLVESNFNHANIVAIIEQCAGCREFCGEFFLKSYVLRLHLLSTPHPEV